MRFEAQARFMYNLPPIQMWLSKAFVSTCACNRTSHTHTPKTPCTHQRHHVTTQQTPKRLCTAHARAQILTYIYRHIYRLCRLCPKQTADSTSTMDSTRVATIHVNVAPSMHALVTTQQTPHGDNFDIHPTSKLRINLLC